LANIVGFLGAFSSQEIDEQWVKNATNSATLLRLGGTLLRPASPCVARGIQGVLWCVRTTKILALFEGFGEGFWTQWLDEQEVKAELNECTLVRKTPQKTAP
jgi:hypothetical protein